LRRDVVLAALIFFIVLLLVLTAITVAEHGVDIATIISLAIVVFLAIAIIGAAATPRR